MMIVYFLFLIALGPLLGASHNLEAAFSFRSQSHGSFRHQWLLKDESGCTTTSSSALFLAAAASKRNKNSKKQKASSSRGFGAKPPSFEEVVAQFPTRLPDNAMALPCPCRHQEQQQPTNDPIVLYKDCCAPYHSGERLPESPERVLRSRYSAFCYRIIPFILQTTHPDCSDYQSNQIQWAKDMNTQGMFDDYDFVALDILSSPLSRTLTGNNEDDEGLEAFCKFQVRMVRSSSKPTIRTKNRASQSSKAGMTKQWESARSSDNRDVTLSQDGQWWLAVCQWRGGHQAKRF